MGCFRFEFRIVKETEIFNIRKSLAEPGADSIGAANHADAILLQIRISKLL